MTNQSKWLWASFCINLAVALNQGWAQERTPSLPKPVASSPCQKTSPSKSAETLKDSPQGRVDWFMRGRRSYQVPSLRFAGPGPTVTPADNLGRAFEQLEQTEKTGGPGPVPENLKNSWEELGPRPQTNSNWTDVAGRVTSLALDPTDSSGNTLYVGTAFGGVWKSVNALSGSPRFEPLGDSWRSLSVGAIAIDPRTAPPTVYVGTGEPNNAIDSYYGQGILRSTKNGGWTVPVYSSDNGRYSFRGAAVARILVDPVVPGLVLAAITTATGAVGREGHVGLYESPDGGDHWSLKLDIGSVTDIAYETVSKTYYAAVRGKGFYKRSADGSWAPTHGSPFQCRTGGVTEANFSRASFAVRDGVVWALITDSRGNPSAPFPGDTGLVQSVNGGDQWTPVFLPDQLFNTQGWYDQFLSAPANSPTLLLGGIDVWIANDVQGLDTYWTNLTNSYTGGLVHPDQHAIAVVDERHWFVGTDGGLWLSVNGGGSWSNLNSTLGAIQFVSVTPDLGKANSMFGGSQDNGTSRIDDTGSKLWKTTWSGDGGYTFADPNYTQRTFTENYDISLFRSDYEGGDWNAVVDSRTINEQSAFYVPYDLMPGDSSQIILGTYRVWRGPAVPECPGAGWVPISGDLTAGGHIQAIAVAPSSNDTVYAATSDGFVHVTHKATASDPTTTWISIGKTPLPQPTATDPGRTFSALAVHPSDPQTVYLGVMGFGTGHVFKSPDGGTSWKDISATLPNAPVNWILIDPLVPADVYVANDLGVWVTTDGGQPGSHWVRYGKGLPHVAILQLKMAPFGPRMVLAATHGRGAWGIPPFHSSRTFSIEASPNTELLGPGDLKPVGVRIVPSGGYTGHVNLTCLSPAGLQCSFASTSISDGETTNLILQGSLSQSPSIVRITGTDGTITSIQTVTLVNRNQ